MGVELNDVLRFLRLEGVRRDEIKMYITDSPNTHSETPLPWIHLTEIHDIKIR